MKYKIGDKVKILDVECIMFGNKLLNNGDITKVTRVVKSSGQIYVRATKGNKQRDLLLHPYELKYIRKVEA